MNTKKKSILVAFIALVVVVVSIIVVPTLGQDKHSKEIQIVIKEGEKTIFDDTVGTDAGMLSDLLKEMKKDSVIKLEYKQSTYGMFITGMGVDKLVENDDAAGKYWGYTSDNNKQCKEANFCDAADALKIEDKDAFVFTYESYQ